MGEMMCAGVGRENSLLMRTMGIEIGVMEQLIELIRVMQVKTKFDYRVIESKWVF